MKAQRSTTNHFGNFWMPTKTCFETAYLGENVIKRLKQKVAQKCHHFFGLLYLFKKS